MSTTLGRAMLCSTRMAPIWRVVCILIWNFLGAADDQGFPPAHPSFRTREQIKVGAEAVDAIITRTQRVKSRLGGHKAPTESDAARDIVAQRCDRVICLRHRETWAHRRWVGVCKFSTRR